MGDSDPLKAYYEFRGDIQEAATNAGAELTDDQAEAIAQAALEHLKKEVHINDWYAENPDWHTTDTGQSSAKILADKTGEPIETFESDAELPGLDDLESEIQDRGR